MVDEYVLVHHGIKGQRWGVRRFQNKDGTRTAEGKRREREGEQESVQPTQKRGLTNAQEKALKTAAISVGVAVAIGLAAYGAVKYSEAIKDAKYQEALENGKKHADAAKERLIKEDIDRYEKLMAEGKIKSYQIGTSNEAVQKAQEALDKTDALANEYGNPVKSMSEFGRASDGGTYAVGKVYDTKNPKIKAALKDPKTRKAMTEYAELAEKNERMLDELNKRADALLENSRKRNEELRKKYPQYFRN